MPTSSQMHEHLRKIGKVAPETNFDFPATLALPSDQNTGLLAAVNGLRGDIQTLHAEIIKRKWLPDTPEVRRIIKELEAQANDQS